MKNYTLIIMLASLVFVIECQSNVHFENSIQNFQSFILEEVVDTSFRNTYKDENFFMVLNPSGLYAKGYCGIFFKKSYDIIEFNQISSKLKQNSIFDNTLKDIDNVYVPNFKNETSFEKFPIPSFDDALLGLRKELNEDSSEILILNKKRGQYFTQKGIEEVKKFTKNNVNKIGTGYSNGLVIDYQSRKIIYWTIVW